jgi:hypothetical protein
MLFASLWCCLFDGCRSIYYISWTVQLDEQKLTGTCGEGSSVHLSDKSFLWNKPSIWQIPSGNLYKRLLLDIAIEIVYLYPLKMVMFHSYVNVYQRVTMFNQNKVVFLLRLRNEIWCGTTQFLVPAEQQNWWFQEGGEDWMTGQFPTHDGSTYSIYIYANMTGVYW